MCQVLAIQKSVTSVHHHITCVASVPVLAEPNRVFFAFGPHKKWSKSKEVEGRGVLWLFCSLALVQLELFSPHFSHGPNAKKLFCAAWFCLARLERLLRGLLSITTITQQLLEKLNFITSIMFTYAHFYFLVSVVIRNKQCREGNKINL